MGIIFYEKGKQTSDIGERWGRMHKGIDFSVPVGTSVQSTTEGTVLKTGYDADGYGNFVKIKDASGNTHIYAHLSAIDVITGQVVTAEQQIGLSGNTGNSTGAHVHYQVESANGNILDGHQFLNGSGGSPVYISEESVSNSGGTFADKVFSLFGIDLTDIAKKTSLFLAIILILAIGCFFIYKTFDLQVKGGTK